MIARNSAPISRNKPAAQTKERMRKRTECTGFLATMTANADTTKSGARIQKKKTSACIVRLFVIVPLPDCRSLCGKRAELSQRERRIPCRHGAAASSRAPNTPVDKAHRATGRGRLSLLLRREPELSIRRAPRDVGG